MAATLIDATDAIDVSCLSMLVYGPPGAWKTTLAQTAASPITLDFDRGAHRAFNRKAVMRFERWADLTEAGGEIAKRQTVVVDTIGRALDMLSSDIIAANPKHGSNAGGLSLQGFGALKARFAQWMGQLRLAGKDLVMIAHEKEEKDGDDRYMRPDIQGGSYVEIMKFTDLVGYLSVDRQGKRTLDFNPSDRHLGKNAANWNAMQVPDLAKENQFLASLLAQAKQQIGKTAEASAAVARIVDDWKKQLDIGLNLDDFNAMLPGLAKMQGLAKTQCWHLAQEHATKEGWTFNDASKAFEAKKKDKKGAA